MVQNMPKPVLKYGSTKKIKDLKQWKLNKTPKLFFKRVILVVIDIITSKDN